MCWDKTGFFLPGLLLCLCITVRPYTLNLFGAGSIKSLLLETKHLTRLVQLEQKCFAHPWTRKQYLQLLNQDNFRILGLFREEVLGGYVSFFIMDQEAEIINLAVEPGWRRMGLGKTLVRDALDTCRQAMVREVFLEVRPSSVPALSLYKSFGFREIARRNRYFPDNLEDALVMRLELQDIQC